MVCEGSVDGRAAVLTLLEVSLTLTPASRRFYEWQKRGKDKLAHFVKPKDGLMLFAGLWDKAEWVSPSTRRIDAHTRLTHAGTMATLTRCRLLRSLLCPSRSSSAS